MQIMKTNMRFNLPVLLIIALLLIFKSCKDSESPSYNSLFIDGIPFPLDGKDFSSGGSFPEDTTYVKDVIVGQVITLSLSDSLILGKSVSWSIMEDPGNESTGSEFIYNPTSVGNKTVAIKVGDQSYSAYLRIIKTKDEKPEDDTLVVVGPATNTECKLPEIQILESNGTQFKEGEVFTLTLKGINFRDCYQDFSWDLDGDGKPESTGLRVQHSYSDPGNKIIRLRMKNKQTNKEETQQKIVNIVALPPPPPGPCSALATPSILVNGGQTNEVYMGEPVRFSANTDPCYASFQWDFTSDNQFEAFSNAANYTFSNVGKYNVRLIVKGQNGVQSSIDKEVFVRVRNAKLNALFASMLFMGQTLQLGATAPVSVKERANEADNTFRKMLENDNISIRDGNNVNKGTYRDFVNADLKGPSPFKKIEVLNIKYDNNSGKIKSLSVSIQ
jgi:PKD repeat protein